MINLMPDYMRQEVGYARRNYVLLKWLMTVGVVITAIGLMTVFGQYYINHNTKSLQATAEITQARIDSQDLQETQASIQGLSNNFITITQLLKRQLLFSKMFVKIGSIIPQGAVLSGITLSTTTSAAIDLNVITINRDVATLAFVNISDPTNGLFDKADLLSTSCTTVTAQTEGLSAKYPCSATIKVVIKTDSSFYFLNSLSSSGGNQ